VCCWCADRCSGQRAESAERGVRSLEQGAGGGGAACSALPLDSPCSSASTTFASSVVPLPAATRDTSASVADTRSRNSNRATLAPAPPSACAALSALMLACSGCSTRSFISVAVLASAMSRRRSASSSCSAFTCACVCGAWHAARLGWFTRAGTRVLGGSCPEPCYSAAGNMATAAHHKRRHSLLRSACREAEAAGELEGTASCRWCVPVTSRRAPAAAPKQQHQQLPHQATKGCRACAGCTKAQGTQASATGMHRTAARSRHAMHAHMWLLSRQAARARPITQRTLQLRQC
jgi:hypothetical protein